MTKPAAFEADKLRKRLAEIYGELSYLDAKRAALMQIAEGMEVLLRTQSASASSATARLPSTDLSPSPEPPQ